MLVLCFVYMWNRVDLFKRLYLCFVKCCFEVLQLWKWKSILKANLKIPGRIVSVTDICCCVAVVCARISLGAG